MPERLTQAVVEQWVGLATGTFNVRDIWAELGIDSYEGRHYLRVILNRLTEKGLVINTSKDGRYRKLDNEAPEIDWQKADPTRILPLQFPFGLEEHIKLYPKSIVILAGSKNVGKTAFLYNFIKLNMDMFNLDLYNSETGPEQMVERFAPLQIPDPAPFKVYERYDNFADVINPDNISVIDYLDLNSEVYLVGAEIDAIFRKLNQGAAIIGLQKPPPSVTYVRGEKKIIERDLAYGGGFTAKRAALYISLSESRLKLVYVKTPAKPTINPNNMQWKFSLADDGIHFTDINRFFGEVSNDRAD